MLFGLVLGVGVPVVAACLEPRLDVALGRANTADYLKQGQRAKLHEATLTLGHVGGRSIAQK